MDAQLTEKFFPSKPVWAVPEGSYRRTRCSVDAFCIKSLCVTDYLVADKCLCVLLNLYPWWHLSTVVQYIHPEISWSVCVWEERSFLKCTAESGPESTPLYKLKPHGKNTRQGHAWFFTEEYIQLPYIHSYIRLFWMWNKVRPLDCSEATATLPAPPVKPCQWVIKKWLQSWYSHQAKHIDSAKQHLTLLHKLV